MPELLKVEEVAELLRVKPSTVYVWSEMGFLPCFRVGRLLRFSWAEIESWLADRASADRWSERLRATEPR
jgi:excisionase family DNA binding protein